MELKYRHPVRSPFMDEGLRAWVSEKRKIKEPFIVDVGGGINPHPLATQIVDWGTPVDTGKIHHNVDFNNGRLPYKDNSVDFVICSHTLEDLYNPIWVCSEISRVAKAGVIVTPSPLVECCRGMETPGNEAAFHARGYCHHRYIIWQNEGILTLLPKYPLIEYVVNSELDFIITSVLDSSPVYWDTVLFWEDSIKIHLLQHEKDFLIHHNYGQMVLTGLQRSIEAARIPDVNS